MDIISDINENPNSILEDEDELKEIIKNPLFIKMLLKAKNVDHMKITINGTKIELVYNKHVSKPNNKPVPVN